MNVDRVIRGIGVSPGVAVGPARVVQWELPAFTPQGVAPDQVEAEVGRLREAVRAVRRLLEELRQRTLERAGPEEAKIFDAQILMLEDPEFLRDVENLIRENQLSAERAFEFKTLQTRAVWGQSPSRLLRERVYDLAGVQVRVLNQLLGRPVDDVLHMPDGRPVVVFTRELSPGLTVQFEKERVAGFASEEGTRTAHAAILARSMGIPCVMGLVGGLARIEDGREVMLDGTTGRVVLDPTPAELEQARKGDRARVALTAELEQIVDQPAVTRDDVRVTVRGNLDLPEDLAVAVQSGAEGVGLLRTEFLIIGRAEMPTEDEQAAFFRRVAARFPEHPVVIRSYDLGGDKFPASFRPPPEANPFLGWRAIRVCLDEPEVFRTQIRAVLRARTEGDIQLMLPFVTDLDEIDRTRELVEESRRALEREGIGCAADLPVGVMIETPAAAALADRIAERSEFLSVGTNDLTQYVLAVDRGNARLAPRFQPLHPAVLRLLAEIAVVGNRAGRPPSVCGEMASDPLAAFLLLGLGYRILSVAPTALPLIRWCIRQMELEGAEAAARDALAARSARDVAQILHDGLARYVDAPFIGVGRLPGGSGEFTLNLR
jgi:phosphotransferase system enzyme I (PtsI)